MLKEKDEGAAKAKADRHEWQKAIIMAKGHDPQKDAGLLKKAIKKRDHQRKKSEKEWKERSHHVQRGIKDRQKKRQENIHQRRNKKPKRPGFEGNGHRLKARK